ncbi:hypothetical protein BDN67DRAFT_518922 [Paxillus ammoniavirescens]|nr:hypothetical protein BDN67DRAFT_518922 [Paxillus ammoniavirescens]
MAAASGRSSPLAALSTSLPSPAFPVSTLPVGRGTELKVVATGEGSEERDVRALYPFDGVDEHENGYLRGGERVNGGSGTDDEGEGEGNTTRLSTLDAFRRRMEESSEDEDQSRYEVDSEEDEGELVLRMDGGWMCGLRIKGGGESGSGDDDEGAHSDGETKAQANEDRQWGTIQAPMVQVWVLPRRLWLVGAVGRHLFRGRNIPLRHLLVLLLHTVRTDTARARISPKTLPQYKVVLRPKTVIAKQEMLRKAKAKRTRTRTEVTGMTYMTTTATLVTPSRLNVSPSYQKLQVSRKLHPRHALTRRLCPCQISRPTDQVSTLLVQVLGVMVEALIRGPAPRVHLLRRLTPPQTPCGWRVRNSNARYRKNLVCQPTQHRHCRRLARSSQQFLCMFLCGRSQS